MHLPHQNRGCFGLHYLPIPLLCKYVKFSAMFIPEEHVLVWVCSTVGLVLLTCFAWRRRRLLPPTTALWLIPTEATLNRLKSADRTFNAMAERDARTRWWDGNLHVPLCDFATPAEHAAVGKNTIALWAKNLAAGSGTVGGVGWKGGAWKRVAADGVAAGGIDAVAAEEGILAAQYCVGGTSATLQKLLKRMHSATSLKGVRTYDALAMTLRKAREEGKRGGGGASPLAGAWPAALPQLAQLEWKIAVVIDTDPLDDRHRRVKCSQYHSYKLMKVGGGAGGKKKKTKTTRAAGDASGKEEKETEKETQET